MMNIGPIFSSLLATEDTSQLIDPTVVSNQILQDREQSKGFDQKGGWQSEFLDIESTLKPLSDLIKERANSVCKEVMGVDKNVEVRLHNCWANINTSNTPYVIHSSMPHIHANNIISFVYYAKAEPGCGNITLITPTIAQEYTLPMEFTTGQTNPFSSTRMHVTPSSGMLIAFNSYLMHHVEPNMSGQDRISLAFNFALPCHTDAIDHH
jgi:uncharacterized protein (TIGR02466 family)